MLQFFLQNFFMWFWVAVLVVLLIIEGCTFSLTTIWGALSAFVLIFVARTGLAFRWQLLLFFLITVLLLLFTRPFAIKKLKLGREKMNADSILGHEVLVQESILQFKTGSVKSKNGVIWSARSEDGNEILEGAVCVVTGIEGNTLLLKRKEENKEEI